MGKFAVAVSTTLLFFLGSFAYAPDASAWTNSSSNGYYKKHTKNKNGNMSFGNHGKLYGKTGYKHDNRNNRFDSYGKYRSQIAKSFKKKHVNNGTDNNFVNHDNRNNNHNSYGKHWKKSSYKKHDSNNFVKHDNRDNSHNSYGNHRDDDNVNGSFNDHNKWDGKRYAKHDNRNNSQKKNFKKSYNHGKRDGKCYADNN